MELSDNLMYTAMQRLILLHYQKVLYVDLTDDFYSVLKNSDSEWNIHIVNNKNRKISEWFLYFAESPLCHDDDRNIFRELADISKLRANFKENNENPIRCNYRRKNNPNDEHFFRCVMELFPYIDKNNHQIIFLFVREAAHPASFTSKFKSSVQQLQETNQFIQHKKYGEKKKLLVVEDNSVNINMLKEFLSDSYDILEAENGLIGLDILFYNYKDISAIILDLYMPIINGFDFLKKVQTNPLLSSIPILVATSAENNDYDEEKCLTLGASDFVKKPYNPPVVKMRLLKMIKMKEAAEMYTISEFDSLTRLYTKDAFCHHIEMEINKNPDLEYDIAVANIDNFNSIEQYYGQEKCSKITTKMAEIITNAPIQAMFYGRIGERIFAGFGLHSEGFNDEYFKKQISILTNATQIENIQVKVGIYENVDKDEPAVEILDRAISALNSISRKYNSVIAKYDEKVIETQKRNYAMENAFENAIEKEDFEVWYQPKYSAKSKAIVGAEALIRWRGKDKNLISPNEFIPLFETDGLISTLDEYVFKKVCKYQKSRLNKNQKIIPISVNLSRASMFKKDFIKTYSLITSELGIEYSYVPIEITESMAIKSSSVKSLAEELIKEGFSLHMDDFGAGYSSLASLQILHFDVIKLDKTIVDFIGTAGGESLIKHTVAFAKESGMKVVAEGVETKSQFDFLQKINCDYIQGFYFAPPMPQNDFEKLLKINFSKNK